MWQKLSVLNLRAAGVNALIKLKASRAKPTIFLEIFVGRCCMPDYEFLCLDCKESFEEVLPLIDYEEGDIICPHCGSTNVEQRWSVFTAITSKKSA